MAVYAQPPEGGGDVRCEIFQYQLVLQQNEHKHHYIWRHNPPVLSSPQKAALLVDLNNVYMPNPEIDKMIGSLLAPRAAIAAVAFAACHAHNRQEIKRRLKAGDIKLYCKAAFFPDAAQARQWLAAQ